MNPYKVLGIPENATQEEIKRAYRLAAAAAHPDRAGGSNDRMRDINIAYRTLTDETNPYVRRNNMEGQQSGHFSFHHVHVNINGHDFSALNDPALLHILNMARMIQAQMHAKMQQQQQQRQQQTKPVPPKQNEQQGFKPNPHDASEFLKSHGNGDPNNPSVKAAKDVLDATAKKQTEPPKTKVETQHKPNSGPKAHETKAFLEQQAMGDPNNPQVQLAIEILRVMNAKK